MTITKAEQLNVERASMMSEFTCRIRDACQEQFPVGTRVKWIHTYDRNRNAKYRRGVVSKHRMFDVEMTSKTGAKHYKRHDFIMPDDQPIEGGSE
jgi:hypothetical protein